MGQKNSENKSPFLSEATDLNYSYLIRKVYKKDFIKHNSDSHKNEVKQKMNDPQT